MVLITLSFEQKIYFELRKIYLNWGFLKKEGKKEGIEAFWTLAFSEKCNYGPEGLNQLGQRAKEGHVTSHSPCKDFSN